MKIGSKKIRLLSKADLKDWTKWVRSWDAKKIGGAETGKPGLNWAKWAGPSFGYLSLESTEEEKRANKLRMTYHQEPCRRNQKLRCKKMKLVSQPGRSGPPSGYLSRLANAVTNPECGRTGLPAPNDYNHALGARHEQDGGSSNLVYLGPRFYLGAPDF